MPWRVLCLACSGSNDDVGSRDDTGPVERTPVAPGVYELDGVDDALPSGDLQPFFDAVGEARFVGIGESVHTSGDFEQLKFRVAKALVEEKGFRAIGFETWWDDALVVEEYVRTCEGSATDAMWNLLWPWGDVAIRDTLEWMCSWNQDHPDDPVTLWGWDIQQPWDDGARLDAFFATAAPADAPTLSAAIRTCLGVDRADAAAFYGSSDMAEYLGGVDEDDHAACVAGLTAMNDYVDLHEADLVAATSEDDLAWAKISLVGLEGWQWSAYDYADDCASSNHARDVANAYVLQEIHRLSMPEAKSVIWAHNIHLATDSAAIRGGYGDPTFDDPCRAWEGMGTLLNESLGDDYRAFALTGHDVHIGINGWDEPKVIPFDPRATEVVLHDLDVPFAYADLTTNDSIFDEEPYEMWGDWQVLRAQFRGLFYVDTSAASDWAQIDTWNEGCGDDEVKLLGSVDAYDALYALQSPEGASICAVDGACTAAAGDGTYALCIAAHSDVAVVTELDGYFGQVTLLSTVEDARVVDLWIVSDVPNQAGYTGVGFDFPPPPGTGTATGTVYDANYERLEGATVTVSPSAGSTVYTDGAFQPYASQDGTGPDAYFVMGGMQAGWYDVVVDHPTARNCRLTTANFSGTGAIHIPIVDGVETSINLQCTP